jgi:hypothetical protein
MAHRNPFVDFLAAYGPKAASDNMYDEHIQGSIHRYGIDPAIEISPPRVDELCRHFDGSNPASVVLTGTAGDGKTFHCRRVFERLGGDPLTWQAGSKTPWLRLRASGRKLVIVKDLSELTPGEKTAVLDAMAASLCGEDTGTVFLVAANDGQLIASWRDWAEGRDVASGHLFASIQEMLRESAYTQDAIRGEGDRLLLYNLSVMEVEKVFDHLLEQIVEHPQWRGCAGCSLYDPQATDASLCPIRINRARLRGFDEKSPFRARLAAMLDLAAAGGHHLPIRHLLLLAVNILLGDRRPGSPLLTCRRAQNRAREADYAATNPYANVFGTNLGERERQQYQAFVVFDEFGIGRETTAAVNRLLVFDPYRIGNRYPQLIGGDRIYGGERYRRLLDSYLEGDRSDLAEFERALTRQRQRLFFVLPDDDEIDPWSLTVFRFGGQYLRFRNALKDGGRLDGLQNRLTKGLNRTFCGMMLEEPREILFAASGGDGRGRIAPVLGHRLALRRQGPMPYAQFVLPDGRRVPELWILPPGAEPLARLPLPPTHFEYLMRVAAGSLPGSFAQQCYEDFLDFKLLAINRLNKHLGVDEDDDLIALVLLSAADDGRAVTHPIEVRVPA